MARGSRGGRFQAAKEVCRTVFNLLPRDAAFFDMFEKLAQHGANGAKYLLELSVEFSSAGGAIQRIRTEEHAADELTHQALDHLDQTFITPFDREDIHQLVGRLDDIIDEIDALAKRFAMYHVDRVEPLFQKQAQVLVDATTAINEAVQRLHKARRLAELNPQLIEIHRLENVGDDNHQIAVSRLFKGAVDALEVIKWMDLFGRIEQAIDRCDDVGDTLERIVLKNG
jgi:predicted phosphate transport protein (TIGR00153 family)